MIRDDRKVWLGLAGGAVVGAVTFHQLRLAATWVAATAAWVLFVGLAAGR